MSENITVKNLSPGVVEINIEGIIGGSENGFSEDPKKTVSTYGAFREEFHKIDRQEVRTLVVNIRSTGGNVNDALLIHDLLAGWDGEIITRCYGYVASAATIIAQAASKGKREISRNALYLIHQSSSNAEGNTGELAQTIELLEKTDDRIAGVYAKASGKNAANFTRLMGENNGNGRWLSPGEVVEQGLADKIIAAQEISNEARHMVAMLNLPDVPEEIVSPELKKNRTIRETWNKILDTLKVQTYPETATAETQAEMEKNTLSDDAVSELEQQILHSKNPPSDSAHTIVEELQNKISELETINARLKAKATQTLPKEDPSTWENSRGGNAAAYDNDIKNFLTH